MLPTSARLARRRKYPDRPPDGPPPGSATVIRRRSSIGGGQTKGSAGLFRALRACLHLETREYARQATVFRLPTGVGLSPSRTSSGRGLSPLRCQNDRAKT